MTDLHFYTIGHSTRTIEAFLGLLEERHIRTLADIRRFPGSRRLPHFSQLALSTALRGAGIDYVHLPQLGGRRKPVAGSPNTSWRNESFRGYADHMASDEFGAGIEQLLQLAAPAAIMCAEALPWRCHRFLTSDELVRRGALVTHIIGTGKSKEHAMNEAAVDRGGHLEYPAVSGLF